VTRVLFLGDASASGFGSVTFGLGKALLDLGLDLRFVSQNDTGKDLPEPYFSRTVDLRSLVHHVNEISGQLDSNEPNKLIPSLFDGTMKGHLLNGEDWAGWVPQACILLGDVWATRLMVDRAAEAFASIPCFNYTPVEGIDLPPRYAVDPWSVVRPVAMSNFGADEIGKIMPRPPMVYHGVDTDAFHPVGKGSVGSALGWPITIAPEGTEVLALKSTEECKRAWASFFAVPIGRTWLLRTDRHMPRKRYNAMLRAMIPVLYRNPDAVLIIHCQQIDQGGNLPDTISKLPGQRMLTPVSANENAKPEAWSLFERPHAQVVLTNAHGLMRPALTSLYNAADIYLSTSAEGFGLTIAEALACGIPAVGLDYSAVPEVIGPAGVLVPIGGLYDNEYDHFWAVPDEVKYTAAVEELLTRPTHRQKLGRKGPAHVAANFRWDAAGAAFHDLIEAAVAERIAA
jgi:glycosyltransferase involved in cell wall biosynthesis